MLQDDREILHELENNVPCPLGEKTKNKGGGLFHIFTVYSKEFRQQKSELRAQGWDSSNLTTMNNCKKTGI